MSFPKRFIAALTALVTCAAVFAAVALAEGEEGTDAVTDAAEGVAQNVAASAEFSNGKEVRWEDLTDGDETTHVDFGVDRISIKSEQKIAGVYLKFYERTAAWEIEANEKTLECGQNGFLHEYVDLTELGAASELSLTLPRGADLSEIALYTEGTLPPEVQTWSAPLDGGADLVLFATHAGDEHTYFAGVLPIAVDKGARCEVVYFCEHTDEVRRMHEQLDGLWAIGVEYYPVFGAFPNLYAESREEAEKLFAAKGYSEEDFVEWQVENIRRFKPQVLVIHDEKGEDGEGANILNSASAAKAVTLAADTSKYPMSLAEYGEWDVPKTYMHLSTKGQLVLDLDEPLDAYGKKSAYEVSCDGFMQHESILWTARYEWLTGVDHAKSVNDPNAEHYTSAKQIETYSPTKWGLWRTTVGDDRKADMFDNIVLYTRPGDAPRDAETQTEALTEAPRVETAKPEEQTEKNSDNPERDRLMKIVAVAAALVVVGMVIALVLSGMRSHGEGKQKRLNDEFRKERAEENARKLREAREERSRQEQADRDAGVRRIKPSDGHDPSGKGAEREAAIRAARASRGDSAAEHDKPTDKRY